MQLSRRIPGWYPLYDKPGGRRRKTRGSGKAWKTGGNRANKQEESDGFAAKEVLCQSAMK